MDTPKFIDSLIEKHLGCCRLTFNCKLQPTDHLYFKKYSFPTLMPRCASLTKKIPLRAKAFPFFNFHMYFRYKNTIQQMF